MTAEGTVGAPSCSSHRGSRDIASESRIRTKSKDEEVNVVDS
jgi:hypothetical protein